MSTNPRTAAQYRTPTTPDSTAQTPSTGSTTDSPSTQSATAQAPRTFEPANKGELPPMFETEARQNPR